MKTGAPPLIATAANAYWLPLPAAKQTQPVRLLALTAPATEGTEEEALLQNILKACKLPAEAVVVQTALPTAVPLWRELRATYQPEVVLLLSITPQQLGLQVHLPFILPQNFDGAIWIVGPALAVLQKDRNLRQALWTEGLKPCFAGE